MQSMYFIRPAIGTVLILLIPLFGNLYVDGWNWSPFDFLVMGTLIYLAGFTYEFLASKATTTGARVAIGIGVFIVLSIVWTELAVGAVSQLVTFLATSM